MQRLIPLIISTFLILSIGCNVVQARPKYLFKIASLAPSGSVWIQQFEKFSAEVTEKTAGKVGFRIYPGGVMGDDQAMYRKMRVGQLHGGGFTMTGISKIVPDFRVMAIPFLFNSYDEVDYVVDGLLPTFTEKFRENRLELIAMTEVGFIYAMSTKPINTLAELQNSTNWSPTGDPISEKFLSVLGISPIQLSIPDVLSSLQSGLIDTVYNSLYGSIIMQWFTKANNITDVPYGYAYGVFLLDGKAFGKLPEEYKEVIKTAAAKHFPELLGKTRESNRESRQVLVERGTTFIKPEADTVKQLQEKRDLAVKKLLGNSISHEIYEKTTALLQEFRKQQ